MDIFLYNNLVHKGKAEDGPSIPIFNVENLFTNLVFTWNTQLQNEERIMCKLLERIIIE